jgi:DNA mismatch endonuclease (patch repair protein)
MPARQHLKVAQDQPPKPDHLKGARRSALMAKVRRSGTAPELAVRSAAHRLGFRFRAGGRGLPGRPDIVFAKYRAVIFVHGCFWHRHSNCRRASSPSTRPEYWKAKFARNVVRDKRVQRELKHAGWRVLVLWQCELKDQVRLRARLIVFLNPSQKKL